MRGEQEKKCLDFVRERMFFREGEPLKNSSTRKTCFEASDEEFFDRREYFVNSGCCKSYFGLLEEDRSKIENALRKAKQNPNKSEFPDFLLENGFIEHFQVTSSKTNRKGSVHKKKEQEFKRRVSDELEKTKVEWCEVPSYDKVRSKNWSLSNPEHSYEYFVESFHNTWKHHVDSLNKYSGRKEVGAFLVEYAEIALSMFENVYAEWKDGMSQGDMRVPEKWDCYRLSRDKNLLEFIYQYKGQIDYVKVSRFSGL